MIEKLGKGLGTRLVYLGILAQHNIMQDIQCMCSRMLSIIYYLVDIIPPFLYSASTETPSVDVHRYPRRGREQKVYREEDISDDDDYLCKKSTLSLCTE